MIKKSVFEDQLILGMQQQLISQEKIAYIEKLDKAIDYLNSAAEIFEANGFVSNSDQVIKVLEKIAKHKAPIRIDKHTHGLTPEKMIKNLLEHGHVMNLADDGAIKDDIGLEEELKDFPDPEIEDTFEDE
jgi:hypothetical protein